MAVTGKNSKGEKLPKDFRLEDQLAEVYETMESSTRSMFITGRAGSGKSTLLNYFRENTIKNIVVLAPTGLAAIQVGGVTIHSFFGFPFRVMLENDPDIKAWNDYHPKKKIVDHLDTLIIDEVSMVRADLLDAIDQALRLNRGGDLPFGGVQVILIGDIFQLPPVIAQNEMQNYFEVNYANPYFFSSRSFQHLGAKVIELCKIYRQHQDGFISLLDRFRQGTATLDDLEEINTRCKDIETDDEGFTVCLSAINSIADRVNKVRLNDLSGKAFEYLGKSAGNFNEKIFPADEKLVLKLGTQVMMVKNDLLGRWVNGSIGQINALKPNQIKVEFKGGTVHTVDAVTWENKTFKWDSTTKTVVTEIVGTYTQYPIRLAWAITIHKSQGLTFDKIIIELGSGAFAHGQLYVALSRCRTFEGIFLKSKLRPKDIIVDEAVLDFGLRYF